MTRKPRVKMDLARFRMDSFFEHPTLSAHDQMRCHTFIAAIEEVERQFGMRLPTPSRLPIIMKYDDDFERRVNEKGQIFCFDKAPWKNTELGVPYADYVRERTGGGASQ